MSKVLTSTERVVAGSEHVSINQEALEKWSAGFEIDHVNHWFNEAPFDIRTLGTRERLHYLLVFNSISFSYWADQKWKVDYEGEKIDGAYGMIGALGRGIREGVPVTDFSYLADISEADLEHLLRGENTIPLFDRRLSTLREIGRVVRDRFSGNLMELIHSVTSSDELLNAVVALFPSFEDETEYKGETVHFLKRAQLFVADIFQAVEETRDSLKNIAGITACADYKLPQMMRRFGIFEYSEELEERITAKEEIPAGHPFEVEIRANTIWAVENMKRVIQKRFPAVDAIEVNDHLWLISQTKLPSDEPYHRTRTTAY